MVNSYGTSCFLLLQFISQSSGMAMVVHADRYGSSQEISMYVMCCICCTKIEEKQISVSWNIQGNLIVCTCQQQNNYFPLQNILERETSISVISHSIMSQLSFFIQMTIISHNRFFRPYAQASNFQLYRILNQRYFLIFLFVRWCDP